jgi:hypothetical protein
MGIQTLKQLELAQYWAGENTSARAWNRRANVRRIHHQNPSAPRLGLHRNDVEPSPGEFLWSDRDPARNGFLLQKWPWVRSLPT